MKMSTKSLISSVEPRFREWVPLFLRLVLGYGFMNHGWAKLAHGPTGFEHSVAQIGAPFPDVTAWVVPLLELGGGFVLLGRGVADAPDEPYLALS